jgi:hypothetical protein
MFMKKITFLARIMKWGANNSALVKLCRNEGVTSNLCNVLII